MQSIISLFVFIFFFNPQQILCSSVSLDPAFGPSSPLLPPQDDRSPASLPDERHIPDSIFMGDSEPYQPSSIPGEPINNLDVKKICETTKQPQLCEKFLTPLFSSDAMTVLAKAIEATLLQTKLAVKGISNLVKIPFELPENQSGLEDCKESFEDALDNLQSAKDAIAKHDIFKIKSMLSAAVTDLSDCKDFSTNPVILKFDDDLANLVSACLAIAASVK